MSFGSVSTAPKMAMAALVKPNGQLDAQAVQRAIAALSRAVDTAFGDDSASGGTRRVSQQLITNRAAGRVDVKTDRSLVLDLGDRTLYLILADGPPDTRLRPIANLMELVKVATNVAGAITVQYVDSANQAYGDAFPATDLSGSSPVVGTFLWIGWRRNTDTEAPEAVFV